MEGEAYFEVKRNTEKPFIVRSEAMQVRVLGTVFNFKSDKTNRSAVATLIKGEIEVKGTHYQTAGYSIQFRFLSRSQYYIEVPT